MTTSIADAPVPAPRGRFVVRPTSALNALSSGVLLFTLPALVYYLFICVAHYEGALVLPTTMSELSSLASHVRMPTPTSFGILLGWFSWHVVMQIFAPGKWVDGTPLADGTRLPYKLNGWFTFWAMLNGSGGFGLPASPVEM